ncbi:MAG: ATP-binding protein [Alphaproteobacteria bacterium]|nr:ATP-binding protein [Alphaproteobacteria bacterium]MDA8030389.1 ATP-binding protein [Alphaproteobacteria bacterium]
MPEHKYEMRISMNVLNHLGINLYSNTPAVLAEVIANAWDAGATRVDIMMDKSAGEVTVCDNGCGMSLAEINDQYLYIGYRRRDKQDTPLGRKPMGRKGIGKLSLFSIAKTIHVHSKKDGKENALCMTAKGVENAIRKDAPNSMEPYHPEDAEFDRALLKYEQGTAIKLTDLKKRLTELSVGGLRKRLARRFSIIDGAENFAVFLNDEKITYEHRDYFHKAQFLYHYGEEDFARHCKNLDMVNGKNAVFKRENAFDATDEDDKPVSYEINGWIAVAKHSHDLDGSDAAGEKDDNLNNIVIVVRGKVAQEDILHEYRMGGLITKFLYGEIRADFLDDDNDKDIATSSRQKIIEDTARYKALKAFIRKEIVHIWTTTNKLKERQGIKKAAEQLPKIKEWYDSLTPGLRRKANTFFGAIEKVSTDKKSKSRLYANGVLAFETMKVQHTLDELKEIDHDHIESVLKVFADVDDIEAAHYYEIVRGRLDMVHKLRAMQKDDEKEEVVQKFIFDHLWLLDPAWERATEEAEMEKIIRDEVKMHADKDEAKEKAKERLLRVDIQYRKVSGAHVIVELKRASRRVRKTDMEDQIRKYMRVVRRKLSDANEKMRHIEGVCIVGKLPAEWDDENVKRAEMQSLRALDVRVITYDELAKNAFSAYSKFIAAQEEVGKVRKLIREIYASLESDEHENA